MSNPRKTLLAGLALLVAAQAPAHGEIVPEFSRGVGPGWVELGGHDFRNVNCWVDTWRWEGSHVWCTGRPTGVIRYLDTYSREFLADGRCILRNGQVVVWTKKCVAKTDTSITLEGGYEHILDGEVLKIEGRYQARRR